MIIMSFMLLIGFFLYFREVLSMIFVIHEHVVNSHTLFLLVLGLLIFYLLNLFLYTERVTVFLIYFYFHEFKCLCMIFCVNSLNTL